MNFPIKRTISNLGHGLGDYVKKFTGGSEGDKVSDKTVQQLKARTQANDQMWTSKQMKSYKKGGMVHSTGPAYLHKGEMVVPKHTVDAMHKKWMLSDGGAVKYSDHT